MTKEELMKPRYKVVMDYPGSPYNINEVIEPSGVNMHQYLLKQYPDLFKPLEWWEERKVEDMPEYIKRKGCVYKISKWDMEKNRVAGYDRGYWLYLAPATSEWHLIPATEIEYLTYINSKNKQR